MASQTANGITNVIADGSTFDDSDQILAISALYMTVIYYHILFLLSFLFKLLIILTRTSEASGCIVRRSGDCD